MRAALLWDLDGTLLSTARSGVYALEEAARELGAREVDLSALDTAGLTDAQVAEAALRACGLETDDRTLAAFLDAYERHLPECLHRKQGHVMTGVVEILEDLHGREDVACLLLTGNTRRGAQAKLVHYGLDRFFADGAFCETRAPRESIARRAVELANGADRCYVIGDTPHDIRCGKAVGARTVAVASGPFAADELAKESPWLLLERLPPAAEFCAKLDLEPLLA